VSSNNHDADFQKLGLAPTEDWIEVKSAYRRLARKWHPDRCTDSNTDKKKAEEKLKDINQAYDRLSKYHKKHSRLPPREKEIKTNAPENRNYHKTRNTRKTATKPDSEPDPGRAERYSRQSKANKRPRKSGQIIFAIIVISLFLYLGDNGKEARVQTNETPGNAHTMPKEFPSKIPRPPRITRYFTYGSTLGKVHSIQGEPTSIKGDIWYYGKSEVRFDKGRVASWLIDPDTPLKASATKINHIKLFGYGSTTNDVLQAQGRPSLMTINLWEYGSSIVYFKNGVVIRWHNSHENPLNTIE